MLKDNYDQCMERIVPKVLEVRTKMLFLYVCQSVLLEAMSALTDGLSPLSVLLLLLKIVVHVRGEGELAADNELGK